MKSFAFALLAFAGTATASSSLQTLLDRSHAAKTLHSPTLLDAGSADIHAPPAASHLVVNAMLGSSDSFVRNAADQDFSMRMRKRSFVGERVENRSVSGGEAEGGQGSLDEGQSFTHQDSSDTAQNKFVERDGGVVAREKRWIISPTIIQDDTPVAPSIGQNANLLGGSSIKLNTPTAALVAPSFPPRPPTLPAPSPPALGTAALLSPILPPPSETFVAAAAVVPSSAASLPAVPAVTPRASSSALAVASAPVVRVSQVTTSKIAAIASPVTTPFYRTRHAPQRLAGKRQH